MKGFWSLCCYIAVGLTVGSHGRSAYQATKLRILADCCFNSWKDISPFVCIWFQCLTGVASHYVRSLPPFSPTPLFPTALSLSCPLRLLSSLLFSFSHHSGFHSRQILSPGARLFWNIRKLLVFSRVENPFNTFQYPEREKPQHPEKRTRGKERK